MPSLQDMKDDRGIALDRVGVTGLIQTVTFETLDGLATATGEFDLSVALPADSRGVHLSGFARVLAEGQVSTSPEGLRPLLERLNAELGAPESFAEVTYEEKATRTAPVSGHTSFVSYPVRVSASLGHDYTHALTVTHPVMTVCPCSQEATDGIGHSQRTQVEIAVSFDGRLTAGELVELAESCASAPVYPLLTGEDERAVIESAGFGLRWNLEIMRSLGICGDEVAAMGGHARSRFLIQLKSDTSGVNFLMRPTTSRIAGPEARSAQLITWTG